MLEIQLRTNCLWRRAVQETHILHSQALLKLQYLTKSLKRSTKILKLSKKASSHGHGAPFPGPKQSFSSTGLKKWPSSAVSAAPPSTLVDSQPWNTTSRPLCTSRLRAPNLSKLRRASEILLFNQSKPPPVVITPPPTSARHCLNSL